MAQTFYIFQNDLIGLAEMLRFISIRIYGIIRSTVLESIVTTNYNFRRYKSIFLQYLSISAKDFVRKKKSATEKMKEPQKPFF
jgi:hypothetical protein